MFVLTYQNYCDVDQKHSPSCKGKPVFKANILLRAPTEVEAQNGRQSAERKEDTADHQNGPLRGIVEECKCHGEAM